MDMSTSQHTSAKLFQLNKEAGLSIESGRGDTDTVNLKIATIYYFFWLCNKKGKQMEPDEFRIVIKRYDTSRQEKQTKQRVRPN